MLRHRVSSGAVVPAVRAAQAAAGLPRSAPRRRSLDASPAGAPSARPYDEI
ncbi:MAG: hypothetical protein LBE67_05200 [Kocuria palustris]|nr:hypothetical protein [Kocuria palustris]